MLRHQQKLVNRVFTMTASRTLSTAGGSTITAIRGREIIDSRGNPTVEVDVTTGLGTFTASVPSGASTGAYEAHELRDGGTRFLGKGVLTAVNNVNTALAGVVVGMDATDQRAIDNAMLKADGSANKINLGANAILGSKLNWIFVVIHSFAFSKDCRFSLYFVAGILFSLFVIFLNIIYTRLFCTIPNSFTGCQ